MTTVGAEEGEDSMSVRDALAELVAAQDAMNGRSTLDEYNRKEDRRNAAWAAARAALAAPPQEPVALTFDAFRAANVARCLKWHPEGIESWSPSDWLVAVTGELGELASLLKMRNRERDGLPGNKFSPTDKQVADEVADVLTYLDLLSAALGVDLGGAAVNKFNEVSERVGFPDRITLYAHPPAAPEPAQAAPDEGLLRLVEDTANMLRGMLMDPAIPEHAKAAMLVKIEDLEQAVEDRLP